MFFTCLQRKLCDIPELVYAVWYSRDGKWKRSFYGGPKVKSGKILGVL